jgi:hypothetical protein
MPASNVIPLLNTAKELARTQSERFNISEEIILAIESAIDQSKCLAFPLSIEFLKKPLFTKKSIFNEVKICFKK